MFGGFNKGSAIIAKEYETLLKWTKWQEKSRSKWKGTVGRVTLEKTMRDQDHDFALLSKKLCWPLFAWVSWSDSLRLHVNLTKLRKL